MATLTIPNRISHHEHYPLYAQGVGSETVKWAREIIDEPTYIFAEGEGCHHCQAEGHLCFVKLGYSSCAACMPVRFTRERCGIAVKQFVDPNGLPRVSIELAGILVAVTRAPADACFTSTDPAKTEPVVATPSKRDNSTRRGANRVYKVERKDTATYRNKLIAGYEAKIASHEARIEKLRESLEMYDKAYDKVAAENASLREENNEIRAANARLEEENETLRQALEPSG